MKLFDTNVLLDIATADSTWLAWSENQFRTIAAQGPILINPIIYPELAPASPRSIVSAATTSLLRWNVVLSEKGVKPEGGTGVVRIVRSRWHSHGRVANEAGYV